MKVYHWRRAILDSTMHKTTKHVLLTLSCYFNADGADAYPSATRLARDSGLSRKAVLVHLMKARQDGWLIARQHDENGKKWATNHYWATVPAGTVISGGAAGGVTGAGGGVAEGRGGVGEGGGAVYGLHPNKTGISPNELSPKRKAAPAEDAPCELPAWLPHSAWFAFLDMRNKRFKPLTGYAKGLVLTTLQHFHEQGHNLTEVLDASTRNCWSDVYAPREEKADAAQGKEMQRGYGRHGRSSGRPDHRDRSAAAAAIFGTESSTPVIEINAIEVKAREMKAVQAHEEQVKEASHAA